MGHHPGSALARKEAEVDALYAEGAQRALVEAAQAYRDEALAVLVELMRGEGVYSEGQDREGKPLFYTVPPHVRRQAAIDVLDRGFGKPNAVAKVKPSEGGVVVHIQRLTVNQGEAQELPADPIERFLNAKEIDALAVGPRSTE